jgi:heme o synthase
MTQMETMRATSRAGADSASTLWRDAVEMAKPGIVQMVTITAAVGFVLAAMASGAALSGGFFVAALGVLVGTILSASGANTLNQAMEHHRDERMLRTRSRPIPAGRVSVAAAVTIGLLESVVGTLVLWALAGPAPALVSAVTIASYLLVYTPMKPLSTLSTIVGAVPGALPPLIGWTAAQGGSLGSILQPGGWSLVMIVFVWQMPHFLAIAWMYREDYARGGYRVLPVVDRQGLRTGLAAVAWAAALIPVALAPALWTGGAVGVVSTVIGVVLGVAFAAMALRFAIRRTSKAARQLFFASIIYLPVVLLVIVGDAALVLML